MLLPNYFIDYDENFLDEAEVMALRDIVASHHQVLIETFPSNYSATPDTSLTGRYEYFNWLNVKSFSDILEDKLIEKIRKLHPTWKDVFIQCWANTFGPSDNIGWHCHSTDSNRQFFVSHIFLGGADTSTLYIDPETHQLTEIPNKVGAISVIPSNVYHCSTPNLTLDNMRISIAVDIYNADDQTPDDLFVMDKKIWRYKRVKT